MAPGKVKRPRTTFGVSYQQPAARLCRRNRKSPFSLRWINTFALQYCPILTYRTYNVPNKYSDNQAPLDSKWKKRMFVACTEKEQIIPTLHPAEPALTSGAARPIARWLPGGEGAPSAARAGNPKFPQTGGGEGLQRSQGTLGALCREQLPPASPRKIPTHLPERAVCSTPALTAHSTRGGTERGYHRRSRSTVWGLCYTDLSIMILGSPIQGIRCRPCSWYWAFSSSRNSLQA